MNAEIYSILVVEDNPGDFALVEELLLEKFTDVKISRAINFMEAREVLQVGLSAIDFVLLDISLPDKTGEPLIKDTLEMCKDIPVIILTGYADFKFGVKSLSLGAADYILKDDLTAVLLQKTILYAAERRRIAHELEQSEKRVRSFAQQLNNAIEDERARIAREMHDEFGQQLTGLKMSLSSLKKFKGTKEELTPVVDLMVADINESISSLRLFANELRPAILDKLGLFAAIEWLVAQWQKKNDIACQLLINSGGIDGFSDKNLEINIFRICQEALTNISKHANASVVEISVYNTCDKLTIKIADNGNGIKDAQLHRPTSMGLLNISERAHLIGALLKITTSGYAGTCIELTIDGYEK